MKIKSWILILFIAVLAGTGIRLFLLETIRVASPSMSEGQQEGDRILINKWALGARMPLTLGVPFAPDSLWGLRTYTRLTRDIYRIKGLGNIKRNDILAFNDPTSPKMIGRSPILLSRCVGLPGEFLEFGKGKVRIDGKVIGLHPDVSYCYSFPSVVNNLIAGALKNAGIVKQIYPAKSVNFIYLTRHEWFRLCGAQKDIRLSLRRQLSNYDSTIILIPAKGLRMELNDSTYQLYGSLLRKYEGVQLRQDSTGFYTAGGAKITYHIFQENYYFLLNDHQGCLNDSRTLGLIPERYVIGKAWMTLLSPSGKRFLEKI